MKKSGAFLLCALLMWGCSSPVLDRIELSSESDTILPDQKLEISASGNTKNLVLDDSEIRSDGGKLKMKDGKIIFSADLPGIYKIYAQKGDIVSNTLLIQVGNADMPVDVTPDEGQSSDDQAVEQTILSADQVLSDPAAYATGEALTVDGYIAIQTQGEEGVSEPVLQNSDPASGQAEKAALKLAGLPEGIEGHVRIRGMLSKTEGAEETYILHVISADPV